MTHPVLLDRPTSVPLVPRAPSDDLRPWHDEPQTVRAEDATRAPSAHRDQTAGRAFSFRLWMTSSTMP